MERLSGRQLEFLGEVFGADKVNTGASVRELHSRDFSAHPSHMPAVVVWPRDTGQVSRLLAWAQDQEVPITPWGAGTSTEGNPIPLAGGVVVDMIEMNRVLNLWPQDMQVEVEPGVGFQDLNHSLRHEGLFFPPDPGAWATLGGMIANNASGIRTVKYGMTKDYVQELEVVLPGGRIIDTGNRAHKSSSGYDLARLFVGSEGTLGIVTKAVLRLAGLPEHFLAAVAGFPSTGAACQAVTRLIRHGTDPAALELITTPLAKLLNRVNDLDLPESPLLFMEFIGFSNESLEQVLGVARQVCEELGAKGFEAGLGAKNRDHLWSARNAAAETIKQAHPGLDILITDAAVPMSAYEELIAFSSRQVEESGQVGYVFGHAGDGNLHLVWMGDQKDPAQWQKLELANRAIVEKAIELGGTATGEHGVGIGKSKFMPREHGASLEVMRQIKNTLDPKGIMNPGKIFPASDTGAQAS